MEEEWRGTCEFLMWILSLGFRVALVFVFVFRGFWVGGSTVVGGGDCGVVVRTGGWEEFGGGGGWLG